MPDKHLLCEFCSENLELVPAALAAGAARVELCDNLAVGGTTPSFGVISAAVELAHGRGARVMCMVRPRGGDFCYTDAELKIMEADARIALALGADGIVLGCLRRGASDALEVDRAACERIARVAREAALERGGDVDMTFHMAIDALPPDRQEDAIDAIADMGFTRILTHGGPAGTPIEGNLDRLSAYVERAVGRVIILPGGGITWKNAAEVADALGVHEVHGTRIVAL